MTAPIDLQAAEYILGTLSAEERAAFEALLVTDPPAREAVAAWERRIAPLGETVESIAPPDFVWKRIETALPALPRPLPTQGSQERLPAVAAVLRSRNRWRTATLLAGALAAGLAAFGIDRVLVHPEAASYVAMVDRGGSLPALIVRVDLSSHTVFVRPVATEVPAGHSLELWYIGQGKAPRSMGLVDKTEREVQLAPDARVEKADFAVTVEPEGGSPTGAPTGPVVYSGRLLKE